jgi:glucose/arabinose dehydrogenase
MRQHIRAMIVLGLFFCSVNTSAELMGWAPQTIGLIRVFDAVALRQPLALIEAPFILPASTKFRATELPRVWYVVEKSGRVLRLQQLGLTVQQTVFADLRKLVDSSPSEAGLLGMTLAPDFSQNGRVYFSYTRTGLPLTSVLSRWQSRDGGQTVDKGSEQILLEVDQPYRNHNGGDIHFGPDGFLYWGLGDGGAAGDPEGNGQNTQTLLGSLLRLDVSDFGSESKGAYRIPADNPFAKQGGRPEIFAYGLRNPWRWSFDRQTGDLWLADVGQNSWEEIDLIQPGGNYGWNLREGAHCYSGDCRRAGLLEPVAEYAHDEGCSVTGGYVYRGDAIPALRGIYLFGDYCSGKIWGLFPIAGLPGKGPYHRQLLMESGLNIASFAEDRAGELYVLDLGGKIFKLVKKQ